MCPLCISNPVPIYLPHRQFGAPCTWWSRLCHILTPKPAPLPAASCKNSCGMKRQGTKGRRRKMKRKEAAKVSGTQRELKWRQPAFWTVFMLYKYPQQIREMAKRLWSKSLQNQGCRGMYSALIQGCEKLQDPEQKFPSRNIMLGGIHQLLLLAPASMLFNKAAFFHSVEMHSTSCRAN